MARHHHLLDHPSIDVWECLDAHGEPVVYYFDRSAVYAWAFDDDAHVPAAAGVHPRPVFPALPAESKNSGDISSLSPAVPVRVVTSPLSTPDTIWESKLFH
jgi:hypothetical protein